MSYCENPECYGTVLAHSEQCRLHSPAPKRNVNELLQHYRGLMSRELERTVEFWRDFSLDEKSGGYFNNLTDKGEVYDRTKHMWLNSREVWMWCTLYFDSKARGKSQEAQIYLDAARVGITFIRRFAVFGTDQSRIYFALTEEGKPLQIQRKQWSECFYILACVMYGRASGEQEWEEEGIRMFMYFLKYCEDATLLGRPVLAGAPHMLELGVSMFVLSMIDEIRSAGGGPQGKGVNSSLYEAEAQQHLKTLQLFVHHDRKLVFERVRPDGTPDLTSSNGRQLNPGHAIEGAWFLLRFADRYCPDNKHLSEMALNMLDYAFANGWDKVFQGIQYFMDSEGFSPVPLESNMKLWWPHNEAMIAFLMAYQRTRKPEYLERFVQVTEYSLKTFGQTPIGDWYGYANRQGQVVSQNVGAAYKGFFHVPRCFLYCRNLIDALIASSTEQE